MSADHILLLCKSNGILQLTHIELTVDMGDRLGNQLIRIEVHGISIFMIDRLPKPLEFFFFKAFIQRIVQNFGLIAILKHLLQKRIIINSLNQSMNAIFNRLQHFRNRGKGVVLNVIAIVLRYAAFISSVLGNFPITKEDESLA